MPNEKHISISHATKSTVADSVRCGEPPLAYKFLETPKYLRNSLPTARCLLAVQKKWIAPAHIQFLRNIRDRLEHRVSIKNSGAKKQFAGRRCLHMLKYKNMNMFQSFDGVRIAYWDQGDGHPIVLLHGFTASSEINWVRSGIADHLLNSGRRVIMVDSRGHGESDKPHTSYSYWNRAMAKDVGELAMYLMLYDYDILGYSMGAKVAIETELMYGRIRSMALAGLHIYDKDWTMSQKDREARVRSMLDDNPSNKDPYRQFADKTGGDRKAFAARLEGTIFPEFSHWDLKKIHLPILILNGTREYNAEEAAAFFPNARGVSLRGSHVTLLANKNFTNEVLGFFNEIDR